MPSFRRRLSDFLVPSLQKAGQSPIASGGGSLVTLADQLTRGQSQTSQNTSIEGNAATTFGPGAPPPSSPIGGDPRQFQYRPGWNYPTLPGEGRPVSYDTLRAVGGIDWALRKALDVRKNELCSLTFSVIGRDRDRRKQRAILNEQADKVLRIEQFFQKPDGVHSFQTWLRMLLEDWLVVDGATIYKRRNLNPDAGPAAPVLPARLGGLVSLDLVDGSTIKPLLDDSGRLPLPPLPAYQQFLFGMPRESFTVQELVYAPMNAVVNSPYGRSVVETFLYLVSIHLRYWTSQGSRWTDGSLPQGVAEAPPNWSPAQIEAYQVFWDSVLAGDPRALRKLIFVPNGFAWHEFRDDQFDEKLARWLFDCICIAADVTPMEMGMEPSHGGLGGKGLGETEERVQERRSLRPTLKWLFDDILNPILATEFDAPELEWTALELDRESEVDRAKALDSNIRNGILSLDEAIEEMGGEPIGVGRMFVFGQQILFEPDLIAASQAGANAIGLLTTPEQQMALSDQQHQQSMERIGATANAQPNGPPNANPPGTPPGTPAGPKPLPPADDRSNSRVTDAPAVTSQPTQASRKGAEITEELRRWETKALRALKAGKPAAVRFSSELLPEDLETEIREQLSVASDVDAVKGAFGAAVVKHVVLRRLEDQVQQELTARAAP